MDEDWAAVKSLLPPQWRELARSSGALKGLRKDRSPEALLRTLLLHVGSGHSLRETALRARDAKLADMSDVAVFKRLRKSSAWLHAMCVELFRERGIVPSRDGGLRMRAIDATTVKEPGRTGSLWHLRYSIDLHSLACDFFRVAGVEGGGGGDSLRHFPVIASDHVLADRGCSTAAGLRHVVASGGHVTVRVDTGSLPLRTPDGLPFDLSAALSTLTRADAVGNWPAVATDRSGAVTVAGRVCAIGKSREAVRRTEAAPPRETAHEGRLTAAPDAGVRPPRDRVHHPARSRRADPRRSGMVSSEMAAGTRLQAFEVAGTTWTSSEGRGRERGRMAARQASRRVAGGKVDPSGRGTLPLGT